jgi:hypothetical protein
MESSCARLSGIASRVFAIAMLLAAFDAPTVAAPDEIGTVTRLQGAGILTSLGEMKAIDTGSPVHVDDIVSSNAGARVEMSFVDGTRLTLGEKTSLRLDRYGVDASRAANRLAVFLQGAARYVSGRLRASPNRRIVVSMAFASVTVHGTDFWAGPIDDEQGVLLLDGRVEVANRGGAVTLNETGEGTGLASTEEAPRAPTRWPAEKLDRALAATSFK